MAFLFLEEVLLAVVVAAAVLVVAFAAVLVGALVVVLAAALVGVVVMSFAMTAALAGGFLSTVVFFPAGLLAFQLKGAVSQSYSQSLKDSANLSSRTSMPARVYSASMPSSASVWDSRSDQALPRPRIASSSSPTV